ncbi:hypothetical protein QJ854_gp911 [Moumouvirus goulette]|uniref:Uncharacterized protein n=1 Tax=Moumouvirus goulette TaxID=1247379 RepID=M1PLS9_9VIRU|nr:hypothetical protein QJ854_gp911 [Moumouvirus goulette]AGF84871.1 hypothetical protein glt_00062 [Moumouvirus goulette]
MEKSNYFEVVDSDIIWKTMSHVSCDLEKYCIKFDIDKIMYDLLNLPKYNKHDKIPLEKVNRNFYTDQKNKTLCDIIFEKMVEKNCAKILDFVWGNRQQIDFINFIKEKFINLIHRAVTDLLFLCICEYTTIDHVYIYGEYVENIFKAEYTPCNTMKINICEWINISDVIFELGKIFEIELLSHNIVTKEDYFMYESGSSCDHNIDCDTYTYTLYPQIERKSFMQFLLSRPYIQQVLKFFDESQWINLLNLINYIKINLVITRDHFESDVDTKNLCIEIPGNIWRIDQDNLPLNYRLQKHPENILEALYNKLIPIGNKIDKSIKFTHPYQYVQITQL